MVFFKSFKPSTLTILESKNDNVEEGTTLTVCPPLVGPRALDFPTKDDLFHTSLWSYTASRELTNLQRPTFASKKPIPAVLLLKSSHHTRSTSSSKFMLLGDRVRRGEVRWGPTLRANGEFSYTEGYWDWLEDVLSRNKEYLARVGLYDAVYASLFSYDRHASVVRAFCEHWCSATNTLHTSQGELSISLWDLYRIAGLSIDGEFYEEVVPNAEEFYAKTKEGKPLLPPSCRHLFWVYHKLCRKVKGRSVVKISSWIEYWYKGPTKYSKPPRKNSRNKTQKPQDANNPSGQIDILRQRTSEENEVFKRLGVAATDVEPTYLAAFLACWLCKFVLPKGEVDHVRPGVLKLACKMAYNHSFSLAVPVLASIYQGLNTIVDSSDLSNLPTTLPFHFIYGWLSDYFDTHFLSELSDTTFPRMTRFSGEYSAKRFEVSEAHSLFSNYGGASINHLARNLKKRVRLVDRKSISSLDSGYIISLRSSYLSLRQDNDRIVQPYNPHRFSRQFNFVQDAPGQLKDDIRSSSLEMVYNYWASCTKFGTDSEVILPAGNELEEFSVTREYAVWWSKVHQLDSTKPMKITIVNRPSSCSKPQQRKNDELPRDVEESSNSSMPRTRRSPLIENPPTHLTTNSGEEGDVMDIQEDLVHISRRNNVTTNSRERSDNSHDDSDTNFKRRKTTSSLGPTFCDPNASFTLDESTFLDGMVDVSQPLPLDEAFATNGSIGDLLSGGQFASIEAEHLTVPLSQAKETRFFAPPTKSLQANSFGTSKRHSSNPAREIAASDISFCGSNSVDVDKIIRKANLRAALMIQEKIKSIVLKSSLEQLSHFRAELDKLIAAISNFGVDPSSLKVKLENLMTDASTYNSIRLSHSEKMTTEVQSQHLDDIESCLSSALALQKDEAQNSELISSSLSIARSRQEELKREQEQLEEQINRLNSHLLESEAQLLQHQDEVTRLEKEKSTIAKAPVLTSSDTETLKTLQNALECQRNDFKDFNLD